MDLTYKVLGADGKAYGPATLAEINAWLREGRITGDTQVTRSDIGYWSTAANFSELELPRTATGAPTASVRPGQSAARPIMAPTATATTAPSADPATEGQLKSGASWFYWIAGLSLVNSVVAFTGSGWSFILGLGITQVIDVFGQSLESGGKLVMLILDVVAAGVFILFGVFAHKRHTWAFVVGMLLYALDGLIYLLF